MPPTPHAADTHEMIRVHGARVDNLRTSASPSRSG
jgi:hypothetical protein